MAKRISQLPEETAVAVGDQLPLYDVSTGTTKRSTLANLVAGVTDGTLMENQSILAKHIDFSFANAAGRDAAIPSPWEGCLVYLDDLNTVLRYDGSGWRWIDSQHRLGTNLGSDATMANTWTTYASITATSLGGLVEASTEANVANLSSGAYRTFDIRVQCDGSTIGSAITALGAIYIAGGSPYYGFANTFSSTPSAGSHTWTFQMQASAAASVGIKAPRITISEVS